MNQNNQIENYENYEYLEEGDVEENADDAMELMEQSTSRSKIRNVRQHTTYTDIEEFKIKFNGTVRNFTTQKIDTPINREPWKLIVVDVQNLKNKLWPYLVPSIQREVTFVNGKPTWGDKEFPDIDDFSSFVTFFDNRSRRPVTASILSKTDLERWTDGRIITAHVYAYSVSVNSKVAWTNVQRTLLEPASTDRAGAASELELQRLTNELKTTHQEHYQALWINWKAWADYILEQPVINQDRLKAGPPPSFLIHLFSCARLPSDQVLGRLRENVNIAAGVNEGVARDIEALDQTLNEIYRLQEKMNNAVGLLKTQSNVLKQKLANNGTLLEQFGRATNFEENEFGIQMFQNIAMMEDHDH